MGENESDSEKIQTEKFDLEHELSTFAINKVLPSKIVEKLGQRLKEKQVKITKEQLHELVEKIRSVLNSNENLQPEPNKTIEATQNQQKNQNSDGSMISFSENMNKLKERIEIIEGELTGFFHSNGKQGDSSSFNSLNADNIEIPNIMTDPPQGLDVAPLAKIPTDPEGIIVLMKWLQFLIDKCGRINLPEILDYYVDVEWITEDMKISLIDYSNGITAGKDTKESSKKDVNNLPSKDHIQSFLFIQKLKGKKFDKHFVERIDGEIYRLTKVVNKNQP
jgi:flagellar protein FlaD